MLEAAFFRLDGIPRHALRLPFQRAAIEIRYSYPRRSNHCHIAIGKEEEIAGVMKNRWNVGCHEIFVLPQTNDSRRSIASRNDLVWFVGADDYEGKHAGELLYRLAHSIFKRRTSSVAALQSVLDQVSDNFGVSFR